MNLRNLLDVTIPDGTAIYWQGEPEAPTPKHERCIISYDKDRRSAIAGWAIPSEWTEPIPQE